MKIKNINLGVIACITLGIASCNGGSNNPPPQPEPTPPGPDNITLNGKYVISGDFGATSNSPNVTGTHNSNSWNEINFGNASVGLAGAASNTKGFVALTTENINPQWETTQAITASYSPDGYYWYKSTGINIQCNNYPSCNWDLFADPSNNNFIISNYISRDNGKTWQTFNNNGLVPITYGNGIYVALKSNNNEYNAYYSNDAKTWQISNTFKPTASTPYSAEKSKSITFNSSLGLFLAANSISYNNVYPYRSESYYQTSTDGINWTMRNKPIPTNYVDPKPYERHCNINLINNQYVCGYTAQNQNSYQSDTVESDIQIFTSNDGINWGNLQTLILESNITGVDIFNAQYMNGKYYAACNYTDAGYEHSATCVSNDLISWILFSVNNQFKMPSIGNNGSTPPAGGYTASVIYNNNKFYRFTASLISGTGYGSVDPKYSAVSSDFLNWSKSMAGMDVNNYSLVNNTQFAMFSCTLSNYYDDYCYGNDFDISTNWLASTSIGESTFITSNVVIPDNSGLSVPGRANAIAYGNDTYVVASNHGLWYSSNAKVWNDDTIDDYYVYNNVRFLNGKFYALNPSVGQIISSSNGRNWSNYPISGNPSLTDIAFVNNKYFITGINGYLAYSSTGLVNSWTTVNLYTLKSIISIAYGNSTMVLVGTNGLLMYSKDNGNTWSNVNTSNIINTNGNSVRITANINSIIYTNSDGFVAVGNDGIILKSSNGVNWLIDNSSDYDYTNIAPVN